MQLARFIDFIHIRALGDVKKGIGRQKELMICPNCWKINWDFQSWESLHSSFNMVDFGGNVLLSIGFDNGWNQQWALPAFDASIPSFGYQGVFPKEAIILNYFTISFSCGKD